MGRGAAMGLGVTAGGLLGAALRPAVVYAFWLRDADADMTLAILLFSAGIGLVIGVVAVAIAALVRGRWAGPLVGAVGGAVLAYGATALTFLPLFFGALLGLNGLQVVDDAAPLYGAATALAGALSGGGGALLLERLGGSRSPTAAGRGDR